LIPLLEVKNISKYFIKPGGSKLTVFENLSFTLSEGQNITSILLPFGGGKSTLLRLISGLDKNYEGEILLNGKKNKSILPFIPEKPSSFPWYNVIGNINLSLSILGKEKKLLKNEVQEIIELVGLTGYEKHYPNNKSYGFRFRISLARALVISPLIILLDDSFKLMDSETRNEIYELIVNIAAKKNIFFLLASSNITEAATLSDKILLFNREPCNFMCGITVGENKKRLELREDIQSTLLRENVANSTNFSI
jgi:ABC-type nitrate/sulfonate/bicarbonate transport system ATPase subunit